jgi:hypothetical protein
VGGIGAKRRRFTLPLPGGSARSAGVGFQQRALHERAPNPFVVHDDTPLVLATHCARAFTENSPPSRNRGRREGRMPGRHPWPACKTKSRRQSPQVGRTAGLPCAMVDGLYVVSPGTGLIAPVTGDALSAASPTWPQHREARTARFHRRIGYVRPHDRDHAATRRAHRILHPTSVTTAKRPLKRGGMGGTIHDFRKKERKK